MIENIDIGGPTLIRAAAKNHPFTAVVVSPRATTPCSRSCADRRPALRPTRERLALEAFAYTARYDTAIARWFAEREEDFPACTRAYEKVLDLPYGENPHQRAAYYAQAGAAHAPAVDGLEAARQGAVLQQPPRPRRGAPPDRRVRAAGGRDRQAQQPVRRGESADAGEAFDKALATDPLSAYGGIYCFNRRVDRALAEELHSPVRRGDLRPGYDDDALEVLEPGEERADPEGRQERRACRRRATTTSSACAAACWSRTATPTSRPRGHGRRHARKPTEEEWGELLFAWRSASTCARTRSCCQGPRRRRESAPAR